MIVLIYDDSKRMFYLFVFCRLHNSTLLCTIKTLKEALLSDYFIGVWSPSISVPAVPALPALPALLVFLRGPRYINRSFTQGEHKVLLLFSEK